MIAAQTGFAGYAILFAGVAASWMGVPIVGAGALAAAGILASEGELNIWIVIGVATIAAWTGGYIGFWLGGRTLEQIRKRTGRWHRQRERALAAGERIYDRWGPLAVFLTPSWMCGAMRMSLNTFLVWHSVAAVASTCIAAFGAYGIGAAILGLGTRHGALGLVVAAVAIAVLVAVVELRRHRRPDESTGA